MASPGHDFRTGENAEMQAEKNSEPVTIVMPSDVLFKKEQQSSSAVSPGPAFSFVKALKAVNAKLKEHYPESEELFKVILICDGSSDSLNNTIQECELTELITPLSVREERLVDELLQNNIHLYLSAEPGNKVQEAVNKGIAAAVVFTPKNMKEVSEDQLRVAFDGDAVLFSDESERVFKGEGLKGYLKNERDKVNNPMKLGPFWRFLEVLERLQKKLRDKGLYKNCPIRTYLVTSRGPGYDGYRALNTLKSHDMEIDEAVFLGGTTKGPTLERISPHIYFDDQMRHVNAALDCGILACKVPCSYE